MNIDLTHPEILTIEQLQTHLIKVKRKTTRCFLRVKLIYLY
jgi:hypothetical protein